MNNYCDEVLDPNFINAVEINFIDKCIIDSLDKYRNKDNEFHKRSLVLYKNVKDGISEEPCSFHPLSWTSNSCYMDSVLMCLLAVENKFVSTVLNSEKFNYGSCIPEEEDESNYLINKIRLELLNIQDYIRNGNDRGKYDCTPLRKIMKQCKNLEKYSGGNQNDSSEFLNSLLGCFQLFEVGSSSYKEFETSDLKSDANTIISTNEPVRKSIFHGELPIFLHQKITRDDLTTQDLLRNVYETLRETDTGIIRTIIENVRLSSPYLINAVQNINNKPIEPLQIIYGNDKILELTGIIIYLGRCHYTCFFSCRKQWYYYDDIASGNDGKIILVGDYDRMIEDDRVIYNGMIYFYSELFNNLS